MERRMRGNFHVRCGAGEKVKIISKPYLLLSLMHLKGVSSMKGMLYFLRFKKRYKYTFNKDDTEKARLWAYNLAMEIEEKLFLAEIDPSAIDRLFPAKPSSYCRHCPFSIECYKKFVRPQLRII